MHEGLHKQRLSKLLWGRHASLIEASVSGIPSITTNTLIALK